MLASEPEAKTHERGDADHGNPVMGAHFEVVERIYLAAKPARLHREIDLAAERKALAEQYSYTCGGKAPPHRPFQRAYHAALSGFEHIRGGLEHQENVAVGHAQDHDEDNRHTQYSERLEHMRPWCAEDQQER